MKKIIQKMKILRDIKKNNGEYFTITYNGKIAGIVVNNKIY